MSELVSIIMPSYNTAKFIGETIKSVINQTYTNWELIISDDCSDDNTDSRVEEFLTDSRIKYIKNKQNGGAALARNNALKEAKGRWIAFLDSDDLWMPEKLEKQIAFMEEKGYAFTYTCYEEIDENSNPLCVFVSGPKKVTKHKMYNYCWPGCLTVMYDRNIVGDLQIDLIRKNNDYAMWLKVCKKADCYLLCENLAKYRRRSGSISNHSYTALIKWHYRMYRICDRRLKFTSLVFTLRNLFWGAYKKIRYVKK
ncbi:MAG: glycosyltransferase family 2 protein [Clostridia bacterium]|nr:glycosyltransferase family 2 protein [Clostridia bacterium]